MKILLINTNQEKFDTPVMPIGIAYVASSLKHLGHEVKVIDLCFIKDFLPLLKKEIPRFAPDIIGLSLRNIDTVSFIYPNWQLAKVKEIVNTCKSLSPSPIILGGPAVSILPKEIMEYLGCNYAVIGDGEEPFGQIAQRVAAGKPLEGVPGLSCLKNGQFIPAQPNRCKEFSSSGILDWIDPKEYFRSQAGLPIQTKRGCINRCIYCVYANIEGDSYRLRDARDIADEIELLIKKTGYRYFDFVDSTFNMPLRHALEICREIIRRKIKARFTTMGINPKETSEELFSLMKQAGFSSVEITAESASDKMLEAMQKGFTKLDVIRTAELANKSGLFAAWFFLFGSPGETEKTVEESLEFAKKYLSGKNNLVIFTLGVRLFKGTELEKIIRRDGFIAEDYNMLKPLFYLYPGLNKEKAFDRIKEVCAVRNNFIITLEESFSRLSMQIYTHVLKVMRLPPPHWRYISNIIALPVVKQIRRSSLDKIRKKIEEINIHPSGTFTATLEKEITLPV
ncbi:MAG: cobalamin-dependent protein [Candidatus Omnitrophica bacterium]|nr:cobalamin-dependent protein [Candidatus Omnitrophota bacterium]MDD5610070.1 cobalamin-dependent protein [Candidatus Omnitrophota bacterium]